MSTKINVRSPFYIKKTGATSTFTLNLKVWTGSISSPPASAQYSLTKDGVEISAGSYYATFEISELVRDYIVTTFDGEYLSTAVYVNDGTNTYIALDGYGYFEEGINPELSRTKLISNEVIWRPQNENIRIPILNDSTLDVVMVSNGENVRTETFTGTTSSTNVIKYVAASGDVSVDNYKQRVLEDSGTYEFNPLLLKFENVVDVNSIDEIRVYKTDGTYDGVKVRTMCMDKYPNRKITFVNKFGVFQDVYFFAKEIESINTKSEEYKANVVDLSGLTFDTNSHQYKTFNVNGKDAITLNTGYVSEDYNEVLKQMMLSEQVWLTVDDTIYPVTPKTQSLTFKTSLNDKLVDYTVQFEYAFDAIQNIR